MFCLKPIAQQQTYAQAAPIEQQQQPAYGQAIQQPIAQQQQPTYAQQIQSAPAAPVLQQSQGGYGPSAYSGAALAAPAPVQGGAPLQQSVGDSSNNKPFTAVFVPGQPTLFKLGTPGDINSGSYTSI